LRAWLDRLGGSAWRGLSAAVVVIVFGAVLSACGSSGSSSTASTGSTNSGESTTASTSGGENKLIIATLSFPCGFNDYAKSLCAGLDAGAEELPSNFTFEQKSGAEISNVNEFNSLIKTSQQLEPDGMIVLPLGPSAQVPVMKEACGKGIKLVVIDNPVEGLGGCQDSYVAADNHKLGVMDAEWLIEQKPSNKEVGIVTNPPGEFVSSDERVKAFEETLKSAGFTIAGTVTTDFSLEKTRAEFTNLLTAHPNLGAVFAVDDTAGDSVATAIKAAGADIDLITVDGSLSSVERIPTGLSADAAQDPFFEGKEAVLTLAGAIEGKEVPSELTEPAVLVEEKNVDEYIENVKKETGAE
jgi:ABC-type sugar transport system substrate-binding protein